MKLFLLLLTLSTSLAFASSREEAEKILRNHEAVTSVQKRMELMSKLFLGLPYGHSGPLGEGEQGRYDQDPLYRFDTFDCTTFVETISSLALARTADEFEDHLNKIRYEHGEIDYLKRNHFTDLQWIPFNVQNGYLSEINAVVVPQALIKTAEAEINFPGWLKSHKIDQLVVPMATMEEKQSLLEELHGLAASYSITVARVPYIEISTLLAKPALLNRIPHGSIVNFVRPNWDLTEAAGTHQNISHQGFLFWKNKILTLRHASTSNGGFVQEIPFIEYLKKFENHPTLKGIHLMKVNQTSI